ncbi:MAG: hypothetical protein JETT_2527 [Candidatus Jettenia ecosi]|uniref:Uncharacterized protein n=1 Tax=Candidatus Jettenia ecosi TaxID=2494326 RepID=A0A533QA70_9BACT|nr:MAG: hypothetical protein JETT_2527 [Candidatus Jettenia ecosi]
MYFSDTKIEFFIRSYGNDRLSDTYRSNISDIEINTFFY